MRSRKQVSTLFPYTTLFRSRVSFGRIQHVCRRVIPQMWRCGAQRKTDFQRLRHSFELWGAAGGARRLTKTSQAGKDTRSEEHTSELQSRRELVCRLLLEKKI